jgi:glucose-6-phosphate isomerase
LVNGTDLVERRLSQLNDENFVSRIWEKDATLWKKDELSQEQIKDALGWLHIAKKMESKLDGIRDFVKDVHTGGFTHVVHMGMGGSSLAPLVFARSFSADGGLPLEILDSTLPESIQNIEKKINLETTLFIVASKSGTTAEPIAFQDYFFDKVKKIKEKRAGENFVAITDPDTSLNQVAKKLKFRQVFQNEPDIGGRYSALSYFGLLPAALLGANISEILTRSLRSADASSSRASGFESPALILGASLGEMALRGKNKITLIIDESIATLGLWLEQLMAESTGKEGKGLILYCFFKMGQKLQD